MGEQVSRVDEEEYEKMDLIAPSKRSGTWIDSRLKAGGERRKKKQ